MFSGNTGKRNVQVMGLLKSMNAVRDINEAALADNARLKKSLEAAQQIVERNVREGGAAIAAYEVRNDLL